MTDRELKRKIKNAFPVPEAEHKREFFAQISKRQMEHASSGGNIGAMGRRKFYLTQLGYIRKRVWLLSALLLCAALGMDYSVRLLIPEMEVENGLLWCASAVIPLLAVLVVVEVNRSFFYGMQELEMSTRHNLAEIYLARMAFLGAGNFLWILLVLSLFARESRNLLFMEVLYLMVPYLLTIVLALEISRHSRREAVMLSCVTAACVVSASYILLFNIVNIYEERYQSLWVLCFLVLLYLYRKKMVGMKTIGEDMLCSLN